MTKEKIQQAGQQYLVMPNAYSADKDIRQVVAECFVDGAEWANKALIEKACEWLKSNLYNYAGEDDKRNIVPFDNAIFHDFKKAMEE